jgi:phosphoadenosine phosphosulfate reductase
VGKTLSKFYQSGVLPDNGNTVLPPAGGSILRSTDMNTHDDRLEELGNFDAQGIVRWAVERFGTRVSLASSFGAEDQVLTDMWHRTGLPMRLFTLDTGRLFQQTYDVMQSTMKRYGIRYEVYAPDAGELERLLAEDGPNCFYGSVEKRKACCAVRKTMPLARALSGLEAWMTGLRQGQSITRTVTMPIEWDDVHGLYKISPLHNWTEQQVWDYLRANDVPYNVLHDRGFRSIGCAPCTREVAPDEDLRAGRWWWENAEHRECGLHNRPKKG